jgi:hypothetical protein
MSAATMLIAALLPAGCDRPLPKISATVLQQIRSAYPGMTEACLKRIEYGGIEAVPSEVQNCFRMTPPRRWNGLWRDDFEGQRFCPAPARECSYASRGDQVWISFKPGTRPRQGSATGKTFLIDFVGRRTLLPGHHGHMGVFAHEIVVDKLLSISRLGAGPSNRLTSATGG